MQKLIRALGATMMILGVSTPASVNAFGGSFFDGPAFKPVGVTGGSTVCAFNPYNDPGFGEAEISFLSSALGNTSVGGTWWSSANNTTTFNAVTVTDLETDCPFSNVVILSQVGADAASYTAEDLYELVWSATFNGDGQSYTYRVALEGVTNTIVVNTRTLNTAPNVAPTANAGSNQSVQSGTQVTLDGSGSTDSDGAIVSYAWTRTGGTGSGANAVLNDATAVSPTFTDSSLTSNDTSVTHEFSLVVTDDDGDSSVADTVTVTITPPPNAAPTVTASAVATSVTSGTQVQLLGTGNDTDGTVVSYAWTRTGGTGSGANAVLSDATAQNPTFTDNSLTTGSSSVTHQFSVVATDDDGATSNPSVVTITIVAPTNTAPTAVAGATPTTAAAGQSVTLNSTGSNANDVGQTLTYAWSQTAGTAVTLSSSTAAAPTFTAPTLVPGVPPETLTFSLIVNDGFENSAASLVNITVNPPANVDPTANAGPDQTVASAALVTLDGTASDPNNAGQALTFAWSQTSGPSVTLSSTTTAQPTFTAPTLAVGAADDTLVFSLIVNDGVSSSVADTVSITVEPPANTVPTANAGPDQAVTSAASVTLDGSASDANDPGQTLIYSWMQLSGGAVVLSGADTVMPTFTAPTLPIGAADMSLTFQLSVFDGFDTSVADTVVITVQAPGNTAPVANAGADQIVATNNTVTLDGTSSIPNDAGQSLTYAWTQTGGTSVTLSSPSAPSPLFTSPNLEIGDSDAVLTFSLTVNDGFDTSVADTVTVTVTAPPNTPPTANAGADQNVADGSLVTLDGSASSANDAGQVLTYTWSQTGGTAVSFDTTVAQPSFTAPTLNIGDSDAVLTFSLTVNDGFDTSVADTIVVFVRAPGDMTAPVITPPADITAEAGPLGTASVTFAATVTDNVDPVVMPVFRLGSDVITSPYDFGVGANTVLVNATDAAGNVATQQSFVVTITAATAPDAPLITTAAINANRSLTIGGTAEVDATVTVTFPDNSTQTVTATGSIYAVTSAADMAGGTVTVTATDAVGNTSAAATVDLFPDFDGPTVTISGAPSSINDATPFMITITFSEAVTGFVQGDLSVTGAAITSFAGAGAVYTAQITPSGTEAVTISVAAGVAEDDFGNLNDASGVASIGLGAMTATEEMITQVARQRTTQLIRAQPKLNAFLLGDSLGRFNVNATQGAGNFDLGTSPDRPVWLSAQGQWSTQDDIESTYANLSLGSHYRISENLLIGAMAQFDTMTSDNGPMAFDSTGWLAGPYAVARLPDQKLVFSGAYLFGQSDNTLSPLGTYEDTFTSDRSVLTLDVAGEVAFERFMLIPMLDLAYVSDENEAYVDGDGFDVRAMTVTTTEATLGLDVVVPIAVSKGALDLLGGFGASTSIFDDGFTQTESNQGQVTLGARYAFGAANQLSLNMQYDGIGDDDYEAFGATARVEFSF
ncbi:hypothetical protein C7964_101855 [Loktanella sp. PT4BL]|uniref:PKD domain-containing protein n=1 Tax=Loktanella sp. PT4BL TaxID=2135611 RepID=UPI000D80A36D|nr:PKD domain-containing protein [Loktanella sp. PT4BL]PXW72739.1 hypothetical protein C7964_101855 [Loktanella sp. PT4BL]